MMHEITSKNINRKKLLSLKITIKFVEVICFWIGENKPLKFLTSKKSAGNMIFNKYKFSVSQ